MKRAAYVLGRMIGAAAGELLRGFYPPVDRKIVTAEEMQPDFFEGPPDDSELDWEGWAVPAILEVLSENRYTHLGPVYWDDWSDDVAPIIAERIACDPARAITALWNSQLKEQKA